MILTDEQLKERHSSPHNLKNILHKITGKGQHKGQKRGDSKGLDNNDRALIALTAQVDTIENTAEAFGVSTASVSAYKSGVTSLNPLTRSEKSSSELKEILETKKSKVSETALDKLIDALDNVDIEDSKKALTLTTVSKNLAEIHEKMTGKEKSSGVKVTIFSPNQKMIGDYEVVEVNVEQ